jgi:glycosyltransferase involved in cell wall biosynthesis
MNVTASNPGGSGTVQSWVALLGQRDTPVDGVDDYCTFLGHALAPRRIELKQVRVDWDKKGWVSSLLQLRRDRAAWQESWVLLQYTALGWSRRGFPLGALAALAILRVHRARAAVVFHEPFHQGAGTRWIDRIRCSFQDWVIQRLYLMSEKSIFTIPLETIPWLPKDKTKAAFIPIGANIPERLLRTQTARDRNGARKTVAIFCLNPGSSPSPEVADLAYAARNAQREGVPTRLVILGRGTDVMQAEIKEALAGSEVEVSILGMLPPEEVSEVLSKASALLFVGGLLSQTRGSALAGLACGLPIVGYAGAVAGTPMEEAGIELAPYRNREALGTCLVRVLKDEALQVLLREKSCRAQEKYFSWSTIAREFTEALGLDAEERKLRLSKTS